MKSNFTFLLIFFVSIGFAQPTITTDIIPETGTSFTASYNEGTIDINQTGENQVWDYSNLSTIFDITFNILEPGDAPGNESYPDAEFVWQLVEFENYLFYDVTDNVISQLGGVNGIEGDISFSTINTDWEDGFQLPFTFGDSYDFFTAYDNYLFGSFIGSGQRNATLTADGYGTVITPYGSYENVLRVKIVRQEFGILFTQYAWLHPQSFLPVMVYDTDEDPETVDSYYFTDLDFTISNTTELENVFTIQNEQGKITVSGIDDSNAKISLVDFRGQKISAQVRRSGQQVWTIDYRLEAIFAPAVLVVEDAQGIRTQKVYLY